MTRQHLRQGARRGCAMAVCGRLTGVLVIALACLIDESGPAFGQSLEQLRSRLNNVSNRLSYVDSRLRKLESVEQRWIGYGTVDGNELVQSWFRCDTETVTFEPVRPGVFKFHFASRLQRKPVILATALDRWSSMKLESSTARVVDATEEGFTVETFQSLDRTNVAFNFLILKGSGGVRLQDRGSRDCASSP